MEVLGNYRVDQHYCYWRIGGWSDWWDNSESVSDPSTTTSPFSFHPDTSRSSTSTTSPTASLSPSAQRVTTDCPASNGTSFTPGLPSGGPGKQGFNKRCGAGTDGSDLIDAMVIDFDNCIALCANWNIMRPEGPKCTAATFNVNGRSPGNCWAKNGTKFVGSKGDSALLV